MLLVYLTVHTSEQEMVIHRKTLAHDYYGCMWIKSFILFLHDYSRESCLYVCDRVRDADGAVYYAGLAG